MMNQGPKKGTVNNPKGINQYTGAQGVGAQTKVGGTFASDASLKAMQANIKSQQAAIVKGANSVKMVVGDTAKAVGGIAKNMVMSPIDKAVANLQGKTGKAYKGGDIPKYTAASLKMRAGEAADERKKAARIAEIKAVARKGQGMVKTRVGDFMTEAKVGKEKLGFVGRSMVREAKYGKQPIMRVLTGPPPKMDTFKNVAGTTADYVATGAKVKAIRASNALDKAIRASSRGTKYTMDRAVIEGSYAKKMAPIIGGEVALSAQAGYNKAKNKVTKQVGDAMMSTARTLEKHNVKARVEDAGDRIKKRMW
jgi:hypothetical protein